MVKILPYQYNVLFLIKFFYRFATCKMEFMATLGLEIQYSDSLNLLTSTSNMKRANYIQLSDFDWRWMWVRRSWTFFSANSWQSEGSQDTMTRVVRHGFKQKRQTLRCKGQDKFIDRQNAKLLPSVQISQPDRQQTVVYRKWGYMVTPKKLPYLNTPKRTLIFQ